MNQKLDQWRSPILPRTQFADGSVPYNVINGKGLRNKLELPDRTAPLSDQIDQVRDLIQQASAKKVAGNFIKQTGDNVKNPSEIKVSKVRFPQNKSQVKHIFRDVEGHLPDNQTSRQLLQDTANDTNCYLGFAEPILIFGNYNFQTALGLKMTRKPAEIERTFVKAIKKRREALRRLSRFKTRNLSAITVSLVFLSIA